MKRSESGRAAFNPPKPQLVLEPCTCALAGLLWNDLNMPDVAAGCVLLFRCLPSWEERWETLAEFGGLCQRGGGAG